MQGIIYTLTDPRTNLIRYVGQTTRKPKVRLNGHISTTKFKIERQERLTHKENWLKELIELKIADDIIISIIEKCEVEVLDEREIFYIAKIKKTTNLTNSSEGGKAAMTRGQKHTEETKKKISESLKNSKVFQKAVRSEERRKKIGNKSRLWERTKEQRLKQSTTLKKYFESNDGTFKGKSHSISTKKKISEIAKKRFKNTPGTMKGKKHTEEAKKKIIAAKIIKKVGLYNLIGEKLKEFNSTRQAGDYFGISNTSGLSRSIKLEKIYREKYILKYL